MRDLFNRIETYINIITSSKEKEESLVNENFGKLIPALAKLSDCGNQSLVKTIQDDFNKCILSWESTKEFDYVTWGSLQENYIQLASELNIFPTKPIKRK